MNHKEATEWMNGKRSMCNAFGGCQEAIVWCEQADAANMQQAYWLLRAHKEGLIGMWKPPVSIVTAHEPTKETP